MNNYSFQKSMPTKVRKCLEKHSELLQELLFYRGIETAEDADTFLNPDYDAHTHDPFLIKNMEKAVARILSAMKNDEKIVIYSDYDCDGIPGGVILHDFFKKVGYKNFENYIPHRHEEGYGLNISAIEKAAENGATLLITVDCGITDVVPVESANGLGIDVIITDHHLIGEKLPSAYAILNSKQEDDSYPFDLLCGAGVAFKLVQGLLKKGDFNVHDGWEKWLLDMVGLSTIADRVPLVGENRVLAHFGLKVLRKSRRLGLQELCKKMRVNQRHISEGDIGFMIAPRINAASRMDRPEDAFHLLTTDDPARAVELAKHLHKINDVRKGIVASMVKEIKKRLAALSEIKDVIVIGDPRFKPALLGLVANTLIEEYQRPIFLWGRDGGNTIKGSCRSDGSIDLVEFMSRTRDFFIDCGGHAFSGGFSVSNENIHRLEDTLLSSYEKIPKNTVVRQQMIDKQLSLEDISWDTHRLIEQLAPFGEGNPKPTFLFPRIVVKVVELFGKEKNHLRLLFERENGTQVSAIGFFMDPSRFSKPLAEGERIDLVASMEKSLFRNIPELRLRIIDIV